MTNRQKPRAAAALPAPFALRHSVKPSTARAAWISRKTAGGSTLMKAPKGICDLREKGDRPHVRSRATAVRRGVPTCPGCRIGPLWVRVPRTTPSPRSSVVHPRPLERAKLVFFRYFERIFVLSLVAAMLVIHSFVEQKFAFLSFYYLPMILAGFYGGRRVAGLAGGVGGGALFFFPGRAGPGNGPRAARGGARLLGPGGGVPVFP